MIPAGGTGGADRPEPADAALDRLADEVVAAVAAAASGRPLPDPGDDRAARRVHRVVEAIAEAGAPGTGGDEGRP